MSEFRPARRRYAGAALLAACGLAGCAALLAPRRITLSEGDIERALERRFPQDRRLLDIFDVHIATPQVRLDPGRDRLAAVVDLSARDRLLGGRWQGRLSFSSQLRWQADDGSLRLSQVRVDDLALVDPASPLRSAGERLGAALAERVLEDEPIYRLPPDKAEQLRRAGLKPGGVQVTAAGVVVDLVPLQP
ncbi:MAG: DUF1439 domain-containing protein [Burkholderiales bacterium]|nr:DUF1439 domain-containing protein [Burkholderiales bacterium]MDE1925952.1 DUF1439 domain-containing protein [Burkholderiales bacterium]MDE2157807.1 DUF1439 domain-containing protein [Burkholderiales bacterium]MDE2505226.1 DUF1439 domain-containing protein [Burkholderiales bacterium]